ncbi:MAG: transglutaminase-like domain-containing protein [Lachnospiraceae bacterium]|nr:transglutaminase-like domain-containing protein [Lachnospiraceae bacterium]
MNSKMPRSLQTDPHPGFMGRRELKKRDKELETRGVAALDFSRDKTPKKYVAVLLRGLLIFLGAYGTIWGLASSFDLAYNPVKVFVWLLLMSVFSASIYYNRVTFYVGYALMFIIFFVFSVMMYSYINSGFQAFMNAVNEHYVDYFSLPALRVSDEIISDRSLTVPIACIFMGWVYCIMLNVTISSYMNPALTFLITFLPLQIAFYIDIVPPYLCMAMLIMCYASVLVLSRSGNYALPYRYKKYETFVRRRRKKGSDDSYILSAKGMISVFAVSLILSLVFFVVSGALFGESYSTKYVSNRLKNRTDDFVEVIVMNGITSLFNRYEARGGLAHGRLGGVGSVAPDYETDLVITYVPVSTDIVYLRAFVGDLYSVDRFLEEKDPEYAPIEEPFHAEAGVLSMEIENLDADSEYYYLPYHSFYAYGDRDGTSYVEYIPSGLPGRITGDDIGMYDYTLYAFQHYINVPESLIPVLDETVRKADMIGEDRTAQGMLYSCRQLANYFEENYRYSLQPGMTPMGRDVVGYFLTSQDRGYCMHYASSATLLLRYIGIPARYCEGYIIKPSDLAEGELVREDEDGTKHVKVEISDANAHAWVEVYLPGYGWTPYEMTPPSFDEEESETMNGLFGILSNLFSAASRNSTEEKEGSASSEGGVAGSLFSGIYGSLEYLIKPVGYSVLGVMLIIFLISVTRRLRPLLHAMNMKRKGRFDEALLVSYRTYTGKLLRKKIISSTNSDSTELARQIDKTFPGAGAPMIGEIVRKAAFSGSGITDEEYRSALESMNRILKLKAGTAGN